MIDQSSYTFAVVGGLAGAGEPQALSYWAVSDVFEESFFPVHNESCKCTPFASSFEASKNRGCAVHGMFGLINLHGVPKPTYRAYQLLHETGDERLAVTGPPPPPPPTGSCSAPEHGLDVWGGDVGALVENVASAAECCELCVRDAKCKTYTFWNNQGKCGCEADRADPAATMS